MNFANMPELSWTFGYLGVVVLAGLMVVLEIIIFHKSTCYNSGAEKIGWLTQF